MEGYFLKAIAIAQKQQAESLELHAITGLARLWRSQGKTAEVRRRLAEIYGWFTEGFDTKGLQEAKPLLEELDRKEHCGSTQACSCPGLDAARIPCSDNGELFDVDRNQTSQAPWRLSDVTHVLCAPEPIRWSQHDPAGYLCYCADQRRYRCADAKRGNGGGFLITTYPCDKIKEGEVI